MIDSNNLPNCKGEYLYAFIDKRYELYASPKGRKPVGRKEKTSIIAQNKNGVNKYPPNNRLLSPIQVQVGNKILYKFKYK